MCGEGLCVGEGIVCESMHINVHVHVYSICMKYTESAHKVYREHAEVCRVRTELNYINMYTLLYMFVAVYTCVCAAKGKREVDVTAVPCLPLLDYDGGINTLWLG